MRRKKSPSDLRQRRINAGVSLAEIAERFKRGISRERVRQIEAAERVRPETRAAYEAALDLAIRDRRAFDVLIEMLQKAEC